METVMIILGILSICIGLACLTAVILLIRGGKKGGLGLDKELIDELDLLGENMMEIVKLVKQNTADQVKSSQDGILAAFNANSSAVINLLNPYMKATTDQLTQIGKDTKDALVEMRKELNDTISMMKGDINRNLDEVKKDNKESLESVRKDNTTQLEEMRKTVDEKLSATLDTRVQSAFKTVSERLEAVQKGFGEMQDLSSKVGNLNKVFTNVKTRGGWGEVSLQTLLEQILSPEQFATQVKLDKKSKELVDFAVVMPGQAGETVYLPIDSKFPQEDYDRLVDATELGDIDLIKARQKALVDTVKKQAKSISEKYIIPPFTTNFAIMYLPTEGLYAEVVRDSGLCSDLQTKFRITVCGPTTITALLNSLQTGFTTLQIQKRSGEIVNLMNAFRKDFATFTSMISKVKDKAQGVVTSLDAVDKRNSIISRKLNKIVGSDSLESEIGGKAIDISLSDEEVASEISDDILLGSDGVDDGLDNGLGDGADNGMSNEEKEFFGGSAL
ncbi:MAG: DNA recombination protein RmuC [Clostridia bacterium]